MSRSIKVTGYVYRGADEDVELEVQVSGDVLEGGYVEDLDAKVDGHSVPLTADEEYELGQRLLERAAKERADD